MMYYAPFVIVVISMADALLPSLNVDKDAITINVRLIKEINSPRFKRSFQSEDGVKTLPDHLVFGVPVKEDNDAILSLKRTSLVPTITSNGRVDTDAASRNTGVYTDMITCSSMIVRREAGDYFLRGTFLHSGKEWNLQPLSRNARSSKSHQLSPLRAKDGLKFISFVGDTHNPKGKSIKKNPFIKFPGRNKDFTKHIVEIAFVADHSDYTNWVSLVGSSNAVNEMQLWYTYVAEAINIRFNTIKDDEFSIGTRTTVLKIVTSDGDADIADDSVTNGTVNDYMALIDFESWIGKQDDLPNSDHYMWFTGFLFDSGASGIAFVETLCTSRSLSLTRDLLHIGVAVVAAHELGHSLSAVHDSDAGCDDSDQFVMSANLYYPAKSNMWEFSSCAIDTMKSFLRGETCTLPENTSGDDVLPAPTEDKDRAGQVLSLDEQCKLRTQNSSSYFCSDRHDDLSKICAGMLCFDLEADGGCRPTLTQEFSFCGEGKWCVLGNCVDNTTTSIPQPTRERKKLRDCFSNILNKWRSFVKCVRNVFQG